MKASIVILVLLVIGAIYLFVSNKDGSVLDLSEGVIIMQDGSIKGNYSIEDIAGVGLPYECNFKKTDETAQINGVIRIAEGKVRGDFDLDILSTATNFGDSSADSRAFFASHFISKEGFTYTWTSLQAIGYKSEIISSADSSGSPMEQAQIVGLKDKVAYDCKPWNAFLNTFDLPSGISFSELK